MKNTARTDRIALNNLALSASAVGAFALLVTACNARQEPEAAPIAESAHSWQQKFEPVPADVEILQGRATPKLVRAEATPRPAPSVPDTTVELAIAHADDDVDYGSLGQTLIDDGKPKEALVALRKHLHSVPETADLLLVIGRLARQTKAYPLAIGALERAMTIDEGRSDVGAELARVHLDRGHARLAQKAARRAISADRADGVAWTQLGRAAMAQSRWELAEVAFQKAVYLEPVDGLMHNNLGLLFVYMKRGPDAVEMLERAVELLEDDTPHYVFNNLGLAHELAGQYEEAREAFEEALLLNPFYTRAKVNLDRVSKRLFSEADGGAFNPVKDVESTPDGV